MRLTSFLLTICTMLVGACAAPLPAPPAPAYDRGNGPAPGEVRARMRSVIERDAAQVLGRGALGEVLAARTALLVRRPVQFPSAPTPPAVAAAARQASGWIRIGANGVRHGFDAAAARELDRLLASSAFWAEPSLPETMCTDPSGILILARHQQRERVFAQPCGFAGPTGQAAQIVLAGRISDWSQVPGTEWPAGIAFARFAEPVAARLRTSSGFYEERMLAIRSAPEWEGQWQRLTARQAPSPPPAVDFSRDMLLMAAMGPQRSGGYSVAIERVLDQPATLFVLVRMISPGAGCGTIAALTSPVDFVRLPASPKPIRWVIERVAQDCR
jgi:hypothetical protein